MKAVLGKSAAGEVSIDLDRLIASRMLLSANSGGGKSWAIRRLLEQTHGKIQQLVIDPEGEFFTLREHFDYVLAGKGGDCPAEPRSAALLARRLLELGTSAILDLYELTPSDRILFVRRFVEALVDAPRELWHPALVIIDEAHTFAPESGHGQAQSVQAVARLMSQGRKRGFAGVLATQRLSKLAKDVAAEANNVVIGRFTLDVDVARAGASLGMSKTDATSTLRALKPGHFFAYGPAISDDVVELHFGDVKTSHPKAGQRAAPPPPPRERVKKILGQLADLPKEAETEARTLEEAGMRIAQLTRELNAAKKAQPEPKVERVEVSVLKDKDRAALEKLVERAEAVSKDLGKAAADLRVSLSARSVAAEPVRPRRFEDAIHTRGATGNVIAIPRTMTVRIQRDRNGHAPDHEGSAEVGRSGLRRMLVALAQRPQGLTNRQLGVRAGVSSRSGTFSTYLSKARTNGWIADQGEVRGITDAGLAALGPYEPLPEGQALAEFWIGELGSSGAARMLRALVDAHPEGLSNEELGERAGISARSGTFSTYLSKLRSLELVTGRGELRASEELFDGATR